MSTDSYSRNYNEVIAPLVGWITVLNTNTTANSIDLSTVGPNVTSAANADIHDQMSYPGQDDGAVNRFVRITAVTFNIGVVFGPNSNSVTGNGAPNLGNTGVQGSNGCCEIIFAGTSVDFMIHPTTQFMGYVGASNTGTIIVRPSSRGM